MPINYPANRQEIIDRVNVDIQTELPSFDPYVRNTMISAISISYSGGIFDLNMNKKNLQKELFPNTATGQYAQIWGNFKNITLNSATAAIGKISITGNNGVIITAAQIEVQNSNGVKYKSIEDVTITTLPRTVSSIILDGNVATVITADDHNLASTDTVTISGADQAEYNITTSIIVVDAKTFTYEVSGTPITPATGTIIATATNAVATIQCESTGANTNLASGASLYFNSIIGGVNSIVHVLYEGLTGGTDAETEYNYRNRYNYAYRNPFSFFNDSSIISFIKQTNYVSRVWVQDITPTVGDVTIYFVVLDENGFNAIPTVTQVNDIKTKLVDPVTGIKPAPTSPDNVYVKAPIPVVVDFIFSSLDPNTTSMKEAIINNLKEAFGDNANVEKNFPEFSYNSAIWQTIDPVNGDKVNDFTLLTPMGDIIIGTGELAVLGNVTFLS